MYGVKLVCMGGINEASAHLVKVMRAFLAADGLLTTGGWGSTRHHDRIRSDPAETKLNPCLCLSTDVHALNNVPRISSCLF